MRDAAGYFLTTDNMKTRTLYRPVNKAELDLIEASGWKAFPPRLPEQPIFYPVLNQQYAEEITVKWNLPFYGNGYVVRFEVEAEYASQFKEETVGGAHHTELWVPAEQMEEFNSNIIGTIDIVSSYTKNE